MKRLVSIIGLESFFVFFLFLTIGDDLQAVPTFKWNGPWEADFPPETNKTNGGSIAANFGASATENGQITDTGNAGDVGPATAFVRAKATANSGFIFDSISLAEVRFLRTFTLSDSPFGWDVSLGGFINGLLITSSLQSSATVSADVKILPGFVNDFSASAPGFPFAFFLGVAKNRPFGLPAGITNNSLGTAPVPDGLYTILGRLNATADIEPAILTFGGTAGSNFYDGSAGLSFTVDAKPRAAPIPVPRPEPPPILVSDTFGPETTFVEVSALVPPPVPEPLTAGLGLLSLTALGAAMNRRRVVTGAKKLSENCEYDR